MKTIWTVWLDYYATGEGQTLLAWIGYATSATEAQQSFAHCSDSFYGPMCESAEGIIENDVTRQLLPVETFERLRKASGRANVDVFARVHINRT